jgi:hypothetical protein
MQRESINGNSNLNSERFRNAISLPNAKPAEDGVEQIFRRGFADYFTNAFVAMRKSIATSSSV